MDAPQIQIETCLRLYLNIYDGFELFLSSLARQITNLAGGKFIHHFF